MLLDSYDHRRESHESLSPSDRKYAQWLASRLATIGRAPALFSLGSRSTRLETGGEAEKKVWRYYDNSWFGAGGEENDGR